MDVAPHPIGTKAVLRFAVPRAMHVRATLHDMLGRAVATVTDGPMEAGMHTVSLRPGVRTPGAYLLQLRGLDGLTARRVVILR